MSIRDLANTGLNDLTFTPGTSAITFPPGVYDGWRTIVGDANLLGANLKPGITLFGVTSTMPSVAGGNTITPSNALQTAVAAGTYVQNVIQVAAVTFDASKLLTGTTVAGTAGTMPNNGSPTKQPGDSIAPGYYGGGSVANYPHGSQLFTANGTFTVPANVTQITVQAVGGGGGGMGLSAAEYYTVLGANSGTLITATLSVTPNQQYSVTIGAGGTGSLGGTSGATGGTTSFGSVISASGGTGGFVENTNSTGGGTAGLTSPGQPSYSGPANASATWNTGSFAYSGTSSNETGSGGYMDIGGGLYGKGGDSYVYGSGTAPTGQNGNAGAVLVTW